MGIVHHATYPIWFELARTRLCAESGHHYADIEATGYRLTVTDLRVRYRRAARYGDTVVVAARIERLGSRGIRFAYDVARDGETIVEGTTGHVWIDGRGRPCRMPEMLREPFGRLAGGDEQRE